MAKHMRRQSSSSGRAAIALGGTLSAVALLTLGPALGASAAEDPARGGEVLVADAAVADPTDPTDPVDPTDPTDPVDPTDPTDPVDPTDPTDPVDPTDPTDPVDPTDPTDPVDPVEGGGDSGYQGEPSTSGSGGGSGYQGEPSDPVSGQGETADDSDESSSGARLAETGADVAGLAMAGTGLLGGGGATLAAARLRRGRGKHVAVR
ncbi:hypothetical protein [Agromyces bauzanensis]